MKWVFDPKSGTQDATILSAWPREKRGLSPFEKTTMIRSTWRRSWALRLIGGRPGMW